MATQPIYQFFAELRDYEPQIWRRFQVAKNITLARLGYILMTLFEMQASHLFSLETPDAHNLRCWVEARCNPRGERSAQEMEEYIRLVWGELDNAAVTRYELPAPDDMADFLDDEELPENAAEARLSNILNSPGQRILFSYDFGDGWEVDVKLEGIIRDSTLPGRELPRVLAGEGFGIVEDCGGSYGLMDMREAFRRKSGDQYKMLSEWLGVTELDLDAFDLDDMNFRLKKLPRIFKELYEDQFEPTELSMRILTRSYKAQHTSANRRIPER